MTWKLLLAPWRILSVSIDAGLSSLKIKPRIWSCHWLSKLNFWPWRLSIVKVMALIRKEWDPESWNGDMWEDRDELEDMGLLNPDWLSLPVEAISPSSVEVASLPTFEGNNPAFPERNTGGVPWGSWHWDNVILCRILPQLLHFLLLDLQPDSSSIRPRKRNKL